MDRKDKSSSEMSKFTAKCPGENRQIKVQKGRKGEKEVRKIKRVRKKDRGNGSPRVPQSPEGADRSALGLELQSQKTLQDRQRAAPHTERAWEN